MKKNNDVRSSIMPEKIKIDTYHVYIRSNIHECETYSIDSEETIRTEFVYDEEVYEKDEYIKDKLSTLETTIAEQDELLAMLLLGE